MICPDDVITELYMKKRYEEQRFMYDWNDEEGAKDIEAEMLLLEAGIGGSNYFDFVIEQRDITLKELYGQIQEA